LKPPDASAPKCTTKYCRLNRECSCAEYNAGGFEGGMTNGQPVVVRAAMKPLSTLMKPMRSVDIKTQEEVKATVERSDVCAAPAAAVSARLWWQSSWRSALLDKFGGDSVREMKRNVESYREVCKRCERSRPRRTGLAVGGSLAIQFKSAFDFLSNLGCPAEQAISIAFWAMVMASLNRPNAA